MFYQQQLQQFQQFLMQPQQQQVPFSKREDAPVTKESYSPNTSMEVPNPSFAATTQTYMSVNLSPHPNQVASPSFSSSTPQTPLTPNSASLNSSDSNQPNKRSKTSSNSEDGPIVIPLESTANGLVIQQVMQTVSYISQALEKVRWEQKQLAIPIQREPYMKLDSEQKDLKSRIDVSDETLSRLLDTTILSPNEMHYLLLTQREISLLAKQLELYMQELQGFANNVIKPW
jgi:hypothetical protein